MKATLSNSSAYQPVRPISTGQTLLWFMGGLALMFAIVSIAFAIKLSTEGRLPFLSRKPANSVSDLPSRQVRNAAGLPVNPQVSANTINPGGSQGFSAGAENILPPEAAHLNKAVPTPPAPQAPAAAPAPSSAPAEPVKTAAAPQAPASPAPVAATPAPVAASPAAPVTENRVAEKDTITPMLQAWSAAWEHKDVDGYLAYYAADFKPAKGLSLNAWKEQRRQRLSSPGEISVKLADIQMNNKGDSATIRFTQAYRSDKLSATEIKTLELVRRDGHWLIQQERVGT